MTVCLSRTEEPRNADGWMMDGWLAINTSSGLPKPAISAVIDLDPVSHSREKSAVARPVIKLMRCRTRKVKGTVMMGSDE